MSEPHEAAEAVADDTSFAAFEAAADEATTPPNPGDDAAAAAEPEAQAEQPKPKQTAQERIDELTRARREAERDRDFYKEQALRSPQAQPQTARTQAQPEDNADQEPDPGQYEHGELDASFIRDHATFHARATFRQEMAQRDSAERTAKVRAEAQEQARKLSEDHPDFEDLVGSDFSKVAPLLTQPMGIALTAMPEGVSVAYHLAKAPAEARRIAALEPLAQAVELGKLAQRLSAPAKPTPKTLTDAPDPLPQARGTGGRFSTDPATTNFAEFEKLADAAR